MKFTEQFLPPAIRRIDEILSHLRDTRIAVVGDFCLDAYWSLDTDEPPLSVETGKPIQRVRSQRYTLGGAGNIVANLAAMGARSIHVVGAIGDDLFGQQVQRLLVDASADMTHLQVLPAPWQTRVYAKPYLNDEETPRFDLGAFNATPPEGVEAMAEALAELAGQVDVVILNQQVSAGSAEVALVHRINQIIADHPKTVFLVDARDTAGLYRGAILKMNAHEASRFLGRPRPLDTPISTAEAHALAERLHQQTRTPVFVTRDQNGMLAADADGVHEVLGIQPTGRIDTVGAGDAAVAALAAALARGVDALTAARFANIAAFITVGKVQQTGTATPDEIRAVAADTDYVYAPDLADDPRQATCIEGTEFEIVCPLPGDIRIRHAIFDHDGTLSTLREGWERIMQPMMERAVLGPRYDDADPALYQRVRQEVRTFIDKTTGIQTLVQMQGLVQLVRQFGCVPQADVLDEHGYKRIYNDQLLAMVAGRIEKLERGELSPADFQMKNADAILRRLHEHGVKLYLASGTDEADVVAEAKAMGYADLFEGRIYGAVGDVNVEAKKVVLERILREHRLAGHEFAVFGDGPVEMREARKQDGIAIGICSDEVRRFGFNPAKRSRLIRGGATLLIPDFSQLDALLRMLELD